MNTSVIIEAVGYIGSALVLISFLMASVVKLRVVNSIGSLIFAVYALIIHSYPTAIMNICLVIINVRFLLKLSRSKAPDYRLVPVSPGEGYVHDFLARYKDDIAACFPGRAWEAAQPGRAWLVCFEAATTGILLGSEEDGVLDIALDYTTPAFRDCSVGSFLLTQLPGEGIRALRYQNPEPGHVAYLEKLGYTKRENDYEKDLT